MLYDFFLGAGGGECDGQGEGDLLGGLSSGSGLKVGDKTRTKFNRYVIFYESMEEEAD